jgi:hypothetical protein
MCPRSRRRLFVPGEKHDAREVAPDLSKASEARVAEVVIADPRRAELVDNGGLRRLSKKVAIVARPLVPSTLLITPVILTSASSTVFWMRCVC